MKDLTGLTYNRLTVIALAERRGHSRFWRCRCACGRIVTVSGSHLKDGHSKSCGCLHKELTGQMARTHGKSGTREHGAWKGAKGRCYNPNNGKYPSYGGRGIKMAEAWRSDFPAFLRDMGRCPDGCSLDRIDNAGDYAPGNCRWAVPVTQNNNRRSNSLITFNGDTRTLAEWAKRLNLTYPALHQRLVKHGWSIDRAFSQRQRIY